MQIVKIAGEKEFSERQLFMGRPLKTDRIELTVCGFDPWQVLPARRHPGSDSILLAVRGRGTMYMGGQEFTIGQGEAAYVPAGTRYGLLAGKNDMIMILAQGPMPVDTEQVAADTGMTESGEEDTKAPGAPPRIAFNIYDFEQWQALPMRRNPDSDTILYIARGHGIMLAGDEEQFVDAETAIYVPAGMAYGLISADAPMTAVSFQSPVPVDAEVFGALGYNCPICGLGTPVTTNTYTGCIAICPRCNARLKLARSEDGFIAEEADEPAPPRAETI